MEYIATRSLGYRIVLEFQDPVVEIPVGSHLAEAYPLDVEHNTHAMRVLDGAGQGALRASSVPPSRVSQTTQRRSVRLLGSRPPTVRIA